jgi:hypothetical protein
VERSGEPRSGRVGRRGLATERIAVGAAHEPRRVPRAAELRSTRAGQPPTGSAMSSASSTGARCRRSCG